MYKLRFNIKKRCHGNRLSFIPPLVIATEKGFHQICIYATLMLYVAVAYNYTQIVYCSGCAF